MAVLRVITRLAPETDVRIVTIYQPVGAQVRPFRAGFPQHLVELLGSSSLIEPFC